MNPWLSVWFQPQKTAEWVKGTKPLYGVVVVLLLYLIVTIVAANIDAITGSVAGVDADIVEQQAAVAISGKQKIGVLIDTWVMPVLLLFVTYLVGRYLGGQASLQNIVWVLVWSQLPIVLLTLLTMAMELGGIQVGAPLFNNKISFPNGVPLLDPVEPEVNVHGLLYLLVSMPLLLSSFQIILSGTAAVQGVTVQRAIWFIVAAMIILMLVRLPITLVIGDWDILDVLGLTGIVELAEPGPTVQ